MPKFETRNLDMEFRRKNQVIPVLSDLNLEVREGEFVAIVGPSGCGKSTILNLAAGLLTPSSGSVLYDGSPVPTPNTKVGYITQKDNLLPWRTVRKNISLALEIRKSDRKEIRRRTDYMIELVGLSGFENAYPAQLSGGMRKRVTIARTLAYEPEVILADEPFGALDAQLRMLMQEELLRIWAAAKNTIVFITHDLAEAIAMADRVVVFSKRPAGVKIDRSVKIPRPRDIATVRLVPEFERLYAELWAELAADIRSGDAV